MRLHLDGHDPRTCGICVSRRTIRRGAARVYESARPALDVCWHEGCAAEIEQHRFGAPRRFCAEHRAENDRASRRAWKRRQRAHLSRPIREAS